MIDASEGETIDDLYKTVSSDATGVIFKVAGSHPAGPRIWPMVGGEEVKRLAADLKKIARSQETRAVLLVGDTGVGKELAARVLFEERVYRVLEGLRENEAGFSMPIVIGLRYVAVNCAALVETLAESQLFGLKEKFELPPLPVIAVQFSMRERGSFCSTNWRRCL